jgi:peptidoglycan biosynthesis protein MviN/MurJ (putative lipid II flippase)
VVSRKQSTVIKSPSVLAGSFSGGLSGQITSGAFYAMGDTKPPTKASVLLYTLYIPLKMAVTFRYGLIGLALTMSGYSVANFIVQFLILEKAISQKLSGESVIL